MERTGAGIFGVLVIAGVFIGGYELALTLWNIRPLGDIKAIYITSDPSKDDEINRLSSKVGELKTKCNNQDQMFSLFEGERAVPTRL
jgi:HAMP domain-containing protein